MNVFCSIVAKVICNTHANWAAISSMLSYLLWKFKVSRCILLRWKPRKKKSQGDGKLQKAGEQVPACMRREKRESMSGNRVSPVFPRAEHALQPDGRVNEKDVMPEHHGAHTSRGRNWDTSTGECEGWRYSTPQDDGLKSAAENRVTGKMPSVCHAAMSL